MAGAVPAGDVHGRLQRNGAGGQFGGRVGEGDRAADRAAVPDRRMGNMRHRQGDQRCMGRNQGGCFNVHMARHRADAKCVAGVFDPGEPLDMVDVDQNVRFGQTHVQRRHQALTASQNFCRVAMFRKQAERILQRYGPCICKRCRFHGLSPPCRFMVLST